MPWDPARSLAPSPTMGLPLAVGGTARRVAPAPPPLFRADSVDAALDAHADPAPPPALARADVRADSAGEDEQATRRLEGRKLAREIAISDAISDGEISGIEDLEIDAELESLWEGGGSAAAGGGYAAGAARVECETMDAMAPRHEAQSPLPEWA